MDLNKVMIIGRLTRDPEMRTTPNGTNVCTLSVATNYVYTNQQTGQKVEQVEYHSIVLWRKLAEIAAQYLKKGTQVFVEGRLQTRTWEDKSNVKHYKTEIVGDNMIMLARAGTGGGSAAPAGSAPYQKPAAPSGNGVEQPFVEEEIPTIQQDAGEDINVDDIPF